MVHGLRSALALLTSVCLVASGPAKACDLPPPAVRDLDVQRFYADRGGTIVDPVLKALHARGTAPVRSWLSHVSKDADSALRRSSPSMGAYKARCALEWIEAWARRGALLGTMRTKQAEAERRWTLAGVALAYLKVKSEATAEQRDVIGRWLLILGARSEAAFLASGAKPNNHLYWLGLGLGATAMATGNDSAWQRAAAILQQGLADVAPDGTLKLELARGPRALHYHIFAAMPLATLATLSAARGGAAASFDRAALERLIARCRQGLAAPETFDDLAGVVQERPVKPGAGWLQLAAALAPAPHVLPEPEIPAGHRWLGGNVHLLLTALSRSPSD